MSRVIKAGEAGPLLRRLSTVDLADHLAEAGAVIAEAKRRAAQITAQAREQYERVLKEARESGYETGYQEGLEAGRVDGHRDAHRESIAGFQREHANIVADMQRAVNEVESIRENLRMEAERNLLDFAVAVATKLTYAIGRLAREAAAANFERALKLVSSETDVTVRVHSDDVASMETFAQSVLRQVEAASAVRIVSDDSIAPGGCVVSSDQTDVDATLETQIDGIVSLLLGGSASDA